MIKGVESMAWCSMMAKRLRQHPRAVCNSMLAALERYRPLSRTDEESALTALISIGIDPQELVAHLKRQTLHEIKEGL